MGWCKLSIVLAVVCSLATHAKTQSVTLAWDSDSDPSVVGFNLHYGTSSGQYTQTLNIPTNTATTANVSQGLSYGVTYFFALRAYNSSNVESPNSNEVSASIPVPTPTPTATPSPTSSPSPTPTASPTTTPTATPIPTTSPTPSPSPSTTPTGTPSPTPTPGAVIIGNHSVFTTSDNGNANLLLASECVLSQPATIQSISFYVTAASGQMYLGIYSGSTSQPFQLLASTPVFTPANGWNTQKVSAPLLLQTGTYWLAYLPNSNSLGFVKQDVGLGSVWVGYQFSIMPPTFPTTGVTTTSSQWSLYATLNTGTNSSPTPAPSPSPTPTPKHHGHP